MSSRSDLFPLALVVMAAGAGLALITAIVPFYHTSYVLLVGVLLTGLLPYLVYAVGAWLERGWLSAVLGLLLLAVDLGVKVPARFVADDVAGDRLMYALPLLEGVILVAVFWIHSRVGRRREDGSTARTGLQLRAGSITASRLRSSQ
jgi:hypothetical protein